MGKKTQTIGPGTLSPLCGDEPADLGYALIPAKHYPPALFQGKPGLTKVLSSIKIVYAAIVLIFSLYYFHRRSISWHFRIMADELQAGRVGLS